MVKWIKEIVVGYLLKDFLVFVKDKLEGNKTYLGIVQIVLGILIVVAQAVPEIQPYTQYLLILVELAQEHGIDLGETLLISGQGFTLVGLIDKIRRLFWKKSEV